MKDHLLNCFVAVFCILAFNQIFYQTNIFEGALVGCVGISIFRAFLYFIEKNKGNLNG